MKAHLKPIADISTLQLVSNKRSRVHTGRAVLQHTADRRTFIAEYRTTTEAAESTGVRRTGIIAVCNNYQKLSGGFWWEYRD